MDQDLENYPQWRIDTMAVRLSPLCMYNPAFTKARDALVAALFIELLEKRPKKRGDKGCGFF